ncbi:MAG: hypothetical protein IT391_17750 [Nitrospira sp.]|nr:hypothetical protein [Nitrospira sp.]
MTAAAGLHASERADDRTNTGKQEKRQHTANRENQQEQDKGETKLNQCTDDVEQEDHANQEGDERGYVHMHEK